MTVKEWLSRGRMMNKEIDALKQEKQRLFEMLTGSGAPTDTERVSGTRKNTTEDRYIRYAEYARLIDERIDELYGVKREIAKAIQTVEDATYRALLIKRYLNFKTWEQIAEEMSYSYRQTVRLHDRALRKIEKARESIFSDHV